jgi:ribonuclease BN (tRNA processing enzyme)
VVEVVVLGSGAGIPHPRRGSPSIAVMGEGELLAVDLGSGATRALARASLDYRQLRRILFTHYHPDHVGDVVALLFASRHRREGELQLIGPPGLGEMVQGLLSVFGHWIEPAGYELALNEIGPGDHVVGPWRVAASKVPHTARSVAYRLEGGSAAVVFTGDTAYDSGLVELARGADLLVAECSFPDELAVEGHLSPALVGRLAREAEVSQLLLVHMYPETDSFDLAQECANVFGGKVTVGYDLLRVRVGG